MSRRFPAERPERVPAGDHRRRPLLHCLGVSVVDFRCRAHVEAAGDEEPNATHSIVLVRRGVFARSDRDGTLLADANQILFFNQGQPYRYAHPLPGGDDCTILALDAECAWALHERFVWRRTGEARGPFPVGHAPSTPRAARLHLELLAASGRAEAPALTAQEVLAELVEESMRALAGVLPWNAGKSSAAARRRRDTVEAAKLILNRCLDAPPSLADLAFALECSPFHLSRIFRAQTGLGLRHYLRRLRARLAAERLAHGARDLTALALDLGFCDHSHFTNAFRCEWGVPPSRLRPQPGDRGLENGRAPARRGGSATRPRSP
ncbi:MAG: helix-turn-helix domain-containing protein [Acidobacteriota bacterium]